MVYFNNFISNKKNLGIYLHNTKKSLLTLGTILKVRGVRFKRDFRKINLADYRRLYFLSIAILSFTIFLLTLPKGDTIAQEKLEGPVNLLVTQNDEFKKVTPEDLKMKFPKYSPPPKVEDYRLIILKKYLAQFDSPLKDQAQDFLDASDTYGVDWRLVPAIAGVESTFGKAIPGGHDPSSTSLNAWGWGVWGDHIIKFSSWRDGIFAVTKGLKHNYIDQGLTDPYSLNRKYSSSPFWAGNLIYFLDDIDSFTQNHTQALSTPEEVQNQIFQNYSYLKNEETHFSLQNSD